jgi:predicted 2-oxoglutarate/Fe(II)-dependent dioxygenase YbiX
MKFEVLQNAIVFRNVFEDPARFIKEQKQKPLRDSGLNVSGKNRYSDKTLRDSTQVSVNEYNPFVNKVREVATFANENYFNINISKYCSENHFIQYDSGGKFEQHSDIIWNEDVKDSNKKPVRKISSITLLNNTFTGGKLALWYKGTRYSFEFNAGDIVFFPSYIQHKVDPVESGVRYSLVSWSYGEF